LKVKGKNMPRSTILNIVIDTINQRTGGGTKYINQRNKNFILAYFYLCSCRDNEKTE